MGDWKTQYYDLLSKNALFQRETVKTANELKSRNIPPSFFKYRSFDKNGDSLKGLRENAVWLSPANRLNDPYDCFHHVNYDLLFEVAPLIDTTRQKLQSLYDGLNDPTRAIFGSFESFISGGVRGIISKLEEYGIAKGMTRVQAEKAVAGFRAEIMGNFDKIHTSAVDQIRRAIKICAFSAADITRSFLMWSHYADQHMGFCVEYEGTGLSNLGLYPVVYSRNLFDATALFKDAILGKLNPLMGTLMAMAKYEDWKYEDEWRMLVIVQEIEHGIPRNVPLPKAVYLGTNISPEDKSRICLILKEKGIPTYQMRLSNSEFILIHDRVL